MVHQIAAPIEKALASGLSPVMGWNVAAPIPTPIMFKIS
jgi:hypothetical protein